MSIKFEKLFPTVIARGSLSGALALNKEIIKDIGELSSQDSVGKAWSKENYKGGYTSYASLNDLQFRTRAFSKFAELMQSHVNAFAKAQGWKLKGNRLEMSSFWMNVMPKNVYHTLHLHPHSAISGAYYVNAPEGSVPLRIEDPRMGFYMNAPVRESKGSGLYREVPAVAGTFVLFESFLRHEVPPNRSEKPRLSLSFNYSLENDE